MMNFFRRSKRSKSARNHLYYQQDGKQIPSFEKRLPANHGPRSKTRELTKDRPASTKANKALVKKINEVEKPNPNLIIPDVISSHESQSSLKLVEAQINQREARKDSLENARKSVEVPGQITTKSPRDYKSEARISVEKPSVVITQSSRDNLEARKRTTSFTNSETDAVGTLDEVLRTFDFDDNLHEVQPEADKDTSLKPNDDDTFGIESPYASIAELGDKSLNSTTGTAEYETKPKYMEQLQEPIYAKPIKAKKPTSPNKNHDQNHNILSSFGRDETDKAPPVPPKRFETEDNHIKFSALRKMSPSASLSQSLKKTDWANANEKTTPKRMPKEDKNKNYSLKRGKLSKPLPSGKEYVEPPPDYDVNDTVSSTRVSTIVSDDSSTKDNWTGSLTSSSASGSKKVLKVIRPEVLDLVRNKKEQKKDEAQASRRHDSLVDRSFRLIKKASLKENLASEASGSDYQAIKNEADRWLANSERLRANSQGKKKDFAKNSSSSSLQQTTAQSESGSAPGAAKAESGSETRANQPGRGSASGATQLASGSPERTAKPEGGSLKRIAQSKSGIPEVTAQDERESYQKTEQVENGSPKTTAQHRNGSFKKEFLSTEDENLVRLMETGVFVENTTSSTGNEAKNSGYVPRALRMSFGQSWNGIRKDRRAWKSREMNNVPSHSLRKGSKKLSNRLDEQNQEPEMLF